jgi:hypothetical protein
MFATLTFLRNFGKDCGLDDKDSKENTIDKYILITVLFPVCIALWIIIIFFKLLYKFTKWYAYEKDY